MYNFFEAQMRAVERQRLARLGKLRIDVHKCQLESAPKDGQVLEQHLSTLEVSSMEDETLVRYQIESADRYHQFQLERMRLWASQRPPAPLNDTHNHDPGDEDRRPIFIGPWCENCGDAFDGPERQCRRPSAGRPYYECGRDGHMFRLKMEPPVGNAVWKP